MQKGFTLIELLIVVGIVGILSVVVVSTINPAEILKQSRDAKRLAEIESIDGAVEFALSQNLSLNIGSSTTIYLSLPDSDQGCGNYPSLPVLESPWVYRCSSEANYRNIDGTGWLPVNFASLSTSPFTALPVDSKNDDELGLYYSYTPQGSSWELNVEMESDKFSFNGSGDVESEDGGNTIIVYEAGTNLNLMPKEMSSRLAGIELRVPTSCADTSYSPFGGKGYYNWWTIPGSGEVVVTKLWFWQRSTNMSTSESVEMALYNDEVSDSKISESVVATGTDSVGWISANLSSPVSITLGQTYRFGMGSALAGNFSWAADTDRNCGTSYLPNIGSAVFNWSGELNSVAPDLPLFTYRLGIVGVSYVER